MIRTRITAAALCLLLACTLSARADVLEQVPADALLVFKVNHLKQTSDKVARLANDLGLAQMFPPIADPLGALQQQAKMSAGVNAGGDMAFVYLDPEKFGGHEGKSFILLIPVSDYQAFLGNWPDAKPEGEVTQVTMHESGEDGFIANWGTYAAMSASRDVVANKPANLGIKFPAVTSKELTSQDAILVANFRAIGPKLQPQLRENREKMLAEIERNMANDPQGAKFTPVVKAIMNQALNVADAFLSDAEAGTFGLTLTEEGIKTSFVGEFKPDTYAGRLFAQAKNNADDKLTGLPAGRYLFFGGSVNDPDTATKVLDDLAQPILQEVLALGPEFKAAQDYYDGLKMYMRGTAGGSTGLMAPSGALGAESLLQFASVMRGDSKQVLEGYKKMMTSQQELMTALGLPPDQMKMTYTQGAKTVEGVTFDAFTSEFKFDPDDPSSGQAEQFMTMLYGPQGATVMLGVVDDNKFIQAMGLKDEQLNSVVAAAKGNLSPLSDLPTVKTVMANLPKDNMGVFFVPVDEIVNTGLNYAKQFGMPVPVQLPPDLPPIGGAVLTEGSALRFEMYIPSQLVQSLVAAGLQAAAGMQGGGGPGGGGL